MYARIIMLAACMFVAALCLPLAQGRAEAASLTLDPTNPSDYWLPPFASADTPTPKRGINNLPSMTIGWFDYDFSMDTAGWRKIVVEGKPHIGRLEIDIDAPQDNKARRGSYRADQWVWIPAGKHRLRLLANYWTGLPRSITTLRLDSLPAGQSVAFRVLPNWDKPVSATGKCASFRFEAGGGNRDVDLALSFETSGGHALKKEIVSVPKSDKPIVFERAIPCNEEGSVVATLRFNGVSSRNNFEASQTYTIIDPSPRNAQFTKDSLVFSIDAVTKAPDYASGLTRVVDHAGMRYRESGSRGALKQSRNPSAPQADWFAYRLDGLKPGKPYLFEVEYPDDKDRVFVAALRQAGEGSYPVSLGMETGGIWPVSNTNASRSAIFWPTSEDSRAIIYNYFDDQKAPLSKINFYNVEDNNTARAKTYSDHSGLRDVAYFYEEGNNFKMLVGGTANEEPDQIMFDRYARLAAASGASMLIPSAAVYNFQLYPSQYQLAFQDWGTDSTARLLLAAQKYGLDVVPELHPRADEVLWLAQNEADLEAMLLMSKTGETRYKSAQGQIVRPPHFNPLNREVQKWYVDMVVEFAERYRSYSNFSGVQLRYSNWQNPALNNLVSLDWGYDKDSVSLFLKEGGLSPDLPLGDNRPQSVQKRYDYLTRGTVREQWIDWRCRKIAALFQQIASRVQKLRPDLKVYLSFFALTHGEQPGLAQFKEAGMDISLLQDISGLELVDSRFQYGSKEDHRPWQQMVRDGPNSSKGVALFSSNAHRASTLFPMQYMEIKGNVIANRAIGWSDKDKTPTHVSASSEPTGRLKLARYAEMVGHHDVYMIGDGGNGYVFADEAVQDFFTKFKALPRRPFDLISGVPRGLAIRRNGDIFYVVNMTDEKQQASLTFDAEPKIRHLVSGDAVDTTNNNLTITLLPYQLLPFSIARDVGMRPSR